MVVLSRPVTSAMSEQLTRVNGNGNGLHAPAKPAPIDSGKCEMRLSLIRTNGGTQSRAAIDHDYVSELIEVLESQVLLPAIDVYFDGQDYWLADGFHRYEAHKKLSYPNIFAIVHQGTRWNAVLHSVGANATHGKRRSNDDKHRAVKLLLTDPDAKNMSNRQIAEACKVSHQLVNDVKAVLDVAQKFGKEYPREVAKVAIKHKIRNRGVADEVQRWYENERETFTEVRDSGYIQPGDETEAVHISAPLKQVKAAVAKKHHSHKIIGAQASGKPYTPPAPVVTPFQADEPTEDPTHDLPYTFSVEQQIDSGVWIAVMVIGEFTSHTAAMKAVKEVQTKLAQKECTE